MYSKISEMFPNQVKYTKEQGKAFLDQLSYDFDLYNKGMPAQNGFTPPDGSGTNLDFLDQTEKKTASTPVLAIVLAGIAALFFLRKK